MMSRAHPTVVKIEDPVTIVVFLVAVVIDGCTGSPTMESGFQGSVLAGRNDTLRPPSVGR